MQRSSRNYTWPNPKTPHRPWALPKWRFQLVLKGFRTFQGALFFLSFSQFFLARGRPRQAYTAFKGPLNYDSTLLMGTTTLRSSQPLAVSYKKRVGCILKRTSLVTGICVIKSLGFSRKSLGFSRKSQGFSKKSLGLFKKSLGFSTKPLGFFRKS